MAMSSALIDIHGRRTRDGVATRERERERDNKREGERRRGHAETKAVVYDFGSEPRTFQRSLTDLTRYAGSGLKISSDTPST